MGNALLEYNSGLESSRHVTHDARCSDADLSGCRKTCCGSEFRFKSSGTITAELASVSLQMYLSLDLPAKEETMRAINNAYSLLENNARLDASGSTLVLLKRFKELLKKLCQMPD
jgi:hypothetical protein